MTRIKLRLDDLSVESFATSGGEGKRGTVHGHCSLTVPDTDTDYNTCDCGGSQAADSCLTGACCNFGSASTCVQKICGCTAAGGYQHGSCDITCDTCNIAVETCANTCMTHFTCPTANGYQGC